MKNEKVDWTKAFEENKKITSQRILERVMKENGHEPIGWEFEYEEEKGVDYQNWWDGWDEDV